MEALTSASWMFDAVLAALMLWLAWRALACTDLFEAIVHFIAFSLMMALSWIRLDAPDVALAEAAIGAGLTGVLLLSALVGLRSFEHGAEPAQYGGRVWALLVRLLPIALLVAVAAGLEIVVLSLPAEADGLNADVMANMQDSGVTNPVTAVLLNFRGYDTLLEIAVLLLALLGGKTLAGGFEIPVGFLSNEANEAYEDLKWQVYDMQVKQKFFAKIGIKPE